MAGAARRARGVVRPAERAGRASLRPPSAQHLGGWATVPGRRHAGRARRGGRWAGSRRTVGRIRLIPDLNQVRFQPARPGPSPIPGRQAGEFASAGSPKPVPPKGAGSWHGAASRWRRSPPPPRLAKPARSGEASPSPPSSAGSASGARACTAGCKSAGASWITGRTAARQRTHALREVFNGLRYIMWGVSRL